jgi:hypothetical protein
MRSPEIAERKPFFHEVIEVETEDSPVSKCKRDRCCVCPMCLFRRVLRCEVIIQSGIVIYNNQ